MMIQQSFQNYYRNQHTIPAHSHTHIRARAHTQIASVIFNCYSVWGIWRNQPIYFFSSFLTTNIRELNWKYKNCFLFLVLSEFPAVHFFPLIYLHRNDFFYPTLDIQAFSIWNNAVSATSNLSIFRSKKSLDTKKNTEDRFKTRIQLLGSVSSSE